MVGKMHKMIINTFYMKTDFPIIKKRSENCNVNVTLLLKLNIFELFGKS